MFERFTDQAQRAIVEAQNEVVELRHRRLGTEHLLLGIMHDRNGIAAQALESLDVRIDVVRNQVERHVPRGRRTPNGYLPLSKGMKKTLELSEHESRQLGQDYIGTEHLLLGLIQEGHDIGPKVLIHMGIDLSRVRALVLAILAEKEGLDSPPHGSQQAIEDRLAAIENRLAAIEKMLDSRTDDRPQQPLV